LQAASRRARAARVERGPAIRSAQAVESDVTTAFIKEVVPTAEPWLRKQILLREDRPTVAGILLFADEPQAVLPNIAGLLVQNERSRRLLRSASVRPAYGYYEARMMLPNPWRGIWPAFWGVETERLQTTGREADEEADERVEEQMKGRPAGCGPGASMDGRHRSRPIALASAGNLSWDCALTRANAPRERGVPMRSSGCGAWPRPEASRAGGYGNRRP
jgi:hypothetical protein